MPPVSVNVRGASGIGLLVGIGIIKPPTQPPGGGAGAGPMLLNPIPDQFYLGNAAPVVANPIGVVIYTPS